MSEFLLEARRLSRHFPGRRQRLWRRESVPAVDQVSLGLRAGQTLGVVGESGCGKSTLARMLVGLMLPTSGDILFSGRSILGQSRTAWREYHAQVQLVFQDPNAALNPRKTVRQSLDGPLAILGGMPRAARRHRIAELLDQVGLRPEFAERYPHELSGGQAQRVVIARAIANQPNILVLDEPVSALDVSIQAQVLQLLQRLQRDLGLTYLFISHDLAVVEHFCAEVAVMVNGQVIEHRPTRELFASPAHPYTRSLFAAVPRINPHQSASTRKLSVKDSHGGTRMFVN